MKNVQELLSHIQKTLKAPKSQFNSFGKYSYRSQEDILEAVKPLLPENASVTLEDDIVEVGGRVYVKSTATLRLGNEQTKTSAFARESEAKKGMDDSQITGTASSYARKYALNGLFAIDDTKDADSRDNRQTSAVKKSAPSKQVDWKTHTHALNALKNELAKKGKDEQPVLDTFGVEALGLLTIEQINSVLKRLEKEPDVKKVDPMPDETTDEIAKALEG